MNDVDQRKVKNGLFIAYVIAAVLLIVSSVSSQHDFKSDLFSSKYSPVVKSSFVKLN